MTGSFSWETLAAELDHWSEAGLRASFWWRDDDAAEPSVELDRLFSAADGVPLALAVIPGRTGRALSTRLDRCRQVTVLQHGWMHDDHADGPISSEYPGHRAAIEVRREIAAGYERLNDLFGPRFLPVFAPPWHGFDEGFAPLLKECGLTGLSRKGPRLSRHMEGLTVANIHAVPIRWSSPPSFGGAEPVIEALCRHLRGRRGGDHDADEPTGILTHHLVQDAESYEFLVTLKSLIAAHPAAEWVGAETIFPPAPR